MRAISGCHCVTPRCATMRSERRLLRVSNALTQRSQPAGPSIPHQATEHDNGLAPETSGAHEIQPAHAAKAQHAVVSRLENHTAAPGSLAISKPFTDATIDPSSQPYMLYIPDIDGQGLTSRRQWPALAKAFDFWTVSITAEDRSDFTTLVQFVKAHLDANLSDAPPERPLYLMGEGLGALVAAAVAIDCRTLVDRVLLVNPATCYEGSNLARVGPLLASLPPAVYNSLPLALGPALLNPLSLATSFLPGASLLSVLQKGPDSLLELVPNAAEGVQTVLADVAQLVASLPPDTLRWRLQMLEDGSRSVVPRLPQLVQRTAVLLAKADAVLPSGEQKEPLEKVLPRSTVLVLENRGHALLAEGGLDLLGMLREEGFFVERREFTSPVTRKESNAFGVAGPLELASRKEVQRIGRLFLNKRIRELCSPVFMSTTEGGEIVPGLDGVPAEQRPLLFVGNHQLYALDMYVMVEEMMMQKRLLPRGLAHPTLFGTEVPTDEETGAPPAVFGALLQTYGAVRVSPNNFYRLMKQGEAVLLYPGGLREGFKRKGETYSLFWPERSEFVRMAARFGATIIPFASVGVDDGIEILLDSDEIARIPYFGEQALKRAAALPVARTGVTEQEGLDQRYISPIIAPRVPKRMYFLFQKPIQLSPADAKNRERCDQVYAETKGAVQDGMSYLLQMREQDPYGDFLQRMIYENPLGQATRTAPSFAIEQRQQPSQP